MRFLIAAFSVKGILKFLRSQLTAVSSTCLLGSLFIHWPYRIICSMSELVKPNVQRTFTKCLLLQELSSHWCNKNSHVRQKPHDSQVGTRLRSGLPSLCYSLNSSVSLTLFFGFWDFPWDLHALTTYSYQFLQSPDFTSLPGSMYTRK